MATHFLRVTSGNAAGTQIPLEGALLIGRAAQGAGSLGEDPELSREHARITYGGAGELLIDDLGSTNGTYVNGQRIAAPTPIRDGDSLRIGQTTLQVVGAQAGPQATAAAMQVPDAQVTQARAVPAAPAPPAPTPAGAEATAAAPVQAQQPQQPPQQFPPLGAQRGLSSGVLRLAKQPEAFLPQDQALPTDDPPGRHPTIIAIATVIAGVLIGGMISAAVFS